ncbi:hypothetical protein B0H34DRAFT_439918 [Crassisporium funariophilum]|nr:hypothetical protein B0H34DRAFT_439918 [Crassisporium funariophilum]
MRFSTSVFVAASTLFSVASAAVFNVTVGKDNKNTYEPSSLTGVAAGDTIAFRFVSKSHSLTQSTFDKPCEKKEGGVDSGFYPVDAAATSFPEWSIKVENVSAPLWFYCARAPHCTLGMVFAINPTEAKTFAAFSVTAQGLPAPSTTGGAPNTSQTTAPNTTGGALGFSAASKAASLLAALGLVAGLTL